MALVLSVLSENDFVLCQFSCKFLQAFHGYGDEAICDGQKDRSTRIWEKIMYPLPE